MSHEQQASALLGQGIEKLARRVLELEQRLADIVQLVKDSGHERGCLVEYVEDGGDDCDCLVSKAETIAKGEDAPDDETRDEGGDIGGEGGG